MKFSISCYNYFRITTHLWQPLEWKLFDLKFVFPLQIPKYYYFSSPIWYHDNTVGVKNNLVCVNISGTFYYKDGIIFENLLCKISATLPSSANCSELFHSGKLVLNDNERSWFGFQVGYQPHIINFLHQNCPPSIGFQKLRKPLQWLIWAANQKFALHFSSVRSRAAVIFKSNLTTWKEKIFEKINLQKLWWPAFVPQRGDGCGRSRRVIDHLLWDDALRQAPCSQNREPPDRT